MIVGESHPDSNGVAQRPLQCNTLRSTLFTRDPELPVLMASDDATPVNGAYRVAPHHRNDEQAAR